MTLPKKQKPISQFFSAFLKLTQSFEHLKKNDPQSLCISKIKDCQRYA